MRVDEGAHRFPLAGVTEQRERFGHESPGREEVRGTHCCRPPFIDRDARLELREQKFAK